MTMRPALDRVGGYSTRTGLWELWRLGVRSLVVPDGALCNRTDLWLRALVVAETAGPRAVADHGDGCVDCASTPVAGPGGKTSRQTLALQAGRAALRAGAPSWD